MENIPSNYLLQPEFVNNISGFTRNLLARCQRAINAHSIQKRPDIFDEICQAKAHMEKSFDGEMLIRTLQTTHLQIFGKIILNF